MNHDHISVLTTQDPSNKRVALNPDGTISKSPAGVIYQAEAQTIHVPDLDALKTVYESIGSNSCQTLVLGYVEGTEDGTPYQITTKKNLEQWMSDPQYEKWDHGIIHEGVKFTARTKQHFRFSSFTVFDKDSVEGMPEELNYPEPLSWWSAMCDLVPGLSGCGYLFTPSTTSRIKMPDGSPAFASGGWHALVQVNDADDINRFGTELLVHSLGTEYGFMRPLLRDGTQEVIGWRPWAIFDPTTFSRERILFEGCPVVSGGLSVSDPIAIVYSGGRLNTALLHVTDADAKMVEAKTGYKIEMQRNGVGMSCRLLNDSDLHLDTVIDTEVGMMTVQQFWDSDYDRLRCQAVFRPDSTSMAAYLNQHSTGEPFLFDVGTHTKFCLNKEETFFREVARLQAQQPPTPAEAPYTPPPVEVSQFQQLVAAADKLGTENREQAVQLYLMALELGPLEADDLVKHHLTLWNKSSIEKAARELRGKNRKEAIEYNRQLENSAGGFSLLSIPPDTPMTEVSYFLARHIYVAAEATWHDRFTGISFRADNFNHRYRHLMADYFPEKVLADLPLPRPTDVFSDSPRAMKVDTRTYWPGASSEIVQADEQVSLNSWKPSKYQREVKNMSSVTDENIQPWLDLVEYLMPSDFERNHVLDHIAFMMQHQDIKINHCILMGGSERTGKDTMFQPLARFIGEMNTTVIDAKRMDENFADFLVCKKLVFLEEIHKDGYKDARATENQMKTKLAAPPDVLTLPRKGKVDMIQPNLIQFIVFSNYRDAIHLSSEGARYFCVWSNAVRRPDSYYTQFYKWMNDQRGAYYVARWLLDRDVTTFDPKGPAPSTEWRQEMAQDGKSDREKEILEVIEGWQDTGRSYFIPGEIKKVLDEQSSGRSPYTKLAISRSLNNLRIGKVKAEDSDDDRIKIPKIFENYDGFPISVNSFKDRKSTPVYLVDMEVKGLVHRNNEAVRWDLCPDHLKPMYQQFLDKK